MFTSEDLRELAAQLRAVDGDQSTEGVVVTLNSVDDGTWDSDVHPKFEVQKTPPGLRRQGRLAAGPARSARHHPGIS
jgi:hypothetical protein